MARSFNGVNDAITSSVAPITVLPVTISLWFFPSSSKIEVAYVIGDGSRQLASLYTNNDLKLHAFNNDTLVSNDAPSTGTFATNTWNHGAGTFSPSLVTAFLNGVAGAPSSTTVTTPTPNQESIGESVQRTGKFWAGALAEVAAWNDILTNDEIAALARGVLPKYIRPGALRVYRPLFGLHSPEIDLSGNGNSGTLVGTAFAGHAPVTLRSRAKASASLGTGQALSSISVSPSSVVNGTGSTGTVTLNTPAAVGGVVVTLSSNNVAAVVPASVTVAAGSTSATFAITTATVSSSTPVTITGTFVTTQTAILTVTPTVALASVSVSPTSVVNGAGSTGTVTLNTPAALGGAVVTLSSNNAAAVVPASVTVAAGATTATFAITTATVSTSTAVTITGTLGAPQTTTLTVTPNTVLSSVAVSPASISAGTTSTGTATLTSAAGVGGAVVTLSSNNAAAVVPASVTVAAGATFALFTITTTAVGSSTAVTITGTLGGSQTAVLTVTPASLTLAAIAVSPTSVVNGVNSTGTVTLSAVAPGAATIPTWDHIVLVMEENHTFGEVIGSANASYINNTLVAGGAVLTNYFAITHPSEPNYYALYAGDTFGVVDDSVHSEPDPSLYTVLNAAGKTFKGFVESGSPSKHNPWESFPEGTSVEADFSTFPTDFTLLPDVCFVIPNQLDDMHDGTVAQGDAWLAANIDNYAQWAKSHNSLLIVVWDEDDSSSTNKVPCILFGAHVVQGLFSPTYNHYSTLRTICDAKGVTAPRNGAAATEFATSTFGSGGTTSVPLTSSSPAAVVPSSVIVAAGATTATFPITTTVVGASTPATIGGTFGGVARSTVLTVTPTNVTLASLSIAPSTVPNGVGSLGTLTLSGPALSGGALIPLSSKNVSATIHTVTASGGDDTATLQAAFNGAATGDTISFSAGTYHVSLVTLKSGLIYLATPGTVTILASTNDTAFGTDGTNSHDMIIDGLTFTGTGVTPTNGILDFSGNSALASQNNIIVRNCIFNGNGITSAWLKFSFIINNDFNNVGTPGTGVYCFYADNTLLAGNTFTNCYQGFGGNFDGQFANQGRNNVYRQNKGIGTTRIFMELIGNSQVVGSPETQNLLVRDNVATAWGAPPADGEQTAYSIVPDFGIGTQILNNYGQGPAHGIGIEMSGVSAISQGNYIDGFGLGIIGYSSKDEIINNNIINFTTQTSTYIQTDEVVSGNTNDATLPPPVWLGRWTAALPTSGAAATVPSSALIPAGQTSVTFPITTNTVAASTAVSITGSFGGVPQSATITVTVGLSIASLTVNPSSVVNGIPSTGTVTLTGPAPSSGDPQITAPSAGNITDSSGRVFTFHGGTGPGIDLNGVVTGGLGTILGIHNDIVYTFSTDGINWYYWNTVTSAWTWFGPVSPLLGSGGGAVVTLASSNPAAHVPATLTFPAGATSATFPITTTSVVSSTLATISGTFGGVVKSAGLTITAQAGVGGVSEYFITLPDGSVADVPPQSFIILVAVDTLTVSPSSVLGGVNSLGTVTLSNPAPVGGALVALASDTAGVIVPATLSIPAGATNATFPITTPVVGTIETANISATFGGATGSAPLTLTPTLVIALASLVIKTSPITNPATVVSGTGATGTVTLTNAAAAGGAAVLLSSGNAALVVPPSVTVPAGAFTADFAITTTPVPVDISVSVTGNFGGIPKSAPLLLTATVTLGSVTASPSLVFGGSGATGKVTLINPAPVGGATVALSSNDSHVVVPATVLVAAGATTANFPITTSSVIFAIAATITATFNGATQTTAVTVTPTIALATISLNPIVVVDGATATGTVGLNSPAPSGGALVLLTSSDPGTVIPPSVLIPVGAFSASFTIVPEVVSVSTSVAIGGSFGGTTQTATLTIIPPPVITAAPSTVSATATLTGLEVPLKPTPQQLTIAMNGVNYNMTVFWNVPSSSWVLDIADALNNPIVGGIPLVTGVDLLAQYQYLGINGKLIVSTDNDPTAPPNFNNLGTLGHLYFVPNV